MFDAAHMPRGARPHKVNKGLRRAAIAVALLLAGALLWWLLCPLGTRIEMLRDEVMMLQRWIGAWGEWGELLFVLCYVLAVVLLVPGSALALAAGLAYGGQGVPLALLASTIGASLAFGIARRFARVPLRRFSGESALLHAVERSVSEGGFRAISLIRFSPVVPFNLQNYLFGVTDVPFRLFLPATIVGIFPGTAANVLLAAGSVAGRGQQRLQLALGLLGLLVSVVVGWLLARAVRRRMRIEIESRRGAAPAPDIA